MRRRDAVSRSGQRVFIEFLKGVAAMRLSFIPYPQRLTLLSAKAEIGRDTAVILRMPEADSRLVNMAKSIFGSVDLATGDYALYAADGFAPSYEMNRPEGYLLYIREENVQIAAQDARGLFYGMQTLSQWFEMPQHPAVEISDWPDLALRSDYLDMRGLFPKFDNILDYVREMARYKLNTLVVEYEDKLPRSRKEFCHPTQAWTPGQHARFLQTAYDNFIEIIPLQQSFGHLEYALKQPEYKYLRETPQTPGEMCPLRPGAFELAASLIEETARLHPGSRYIHLGCDEVWSLGQSKECRESGKSRGQIAIAFINRLAEKAVELGKQPIVWHDMIAQADKEDLKALNKDLIVGIWLYSPERVNTVAPKLMEELHALGIRTIPCCSVRASDRSVDQNYPRIEQRLRNIDAWCDLIRQSRSTGMINTNWCSTFSFGNPYGLFETSRYTAFYAAEHCWQLGVDHSDYLERFLAAYHGVYNAKIPGGAERRYDYYKVIGNLLPHVTKNKVTARLIDIMCRLENAVSVNATAFRGILFPEKEVEMDCLQERAPKNYQNYHKIEAELKDLLPQVLSQEMAELFFASRTYPVGLFQKELERILHISL